MGLTLLIVVEGGLISSILVIPSETGTLSYSILFIYVLPSKGKVRLSILPVRFCRSACAGQSANYMAVRVLPRVIGANLAVIY